MSRRKNERYFNPISSQPFSTAGVHRNQGRVGQTSLSRTLVRTPMRLVAGEAVPIGYGSSQNKYPINIISTCCNGSHSNGQTSMTNKGVILSRVTNPTGVYNTACNKSGACNKPIAKDFNPENHTNSALIRRNRTRVMQESYPQLDGKKGYVYNCNSCDAGAPPTHYIGTRKFTNAPYAKNVAPMSASEYMRTGFLYNNKSEHCCDPNDDSSGVVPPDDDDSPNDDSPNDDSPNDDTPQAGNSGEQ